MSASVTEGYFSADSHVVEPADLWITRMDKRFRDRAPHIESRPENDYYMIDGVAPFPVSLEGAVMEDKVRGKVESMMGHRHADTRPGAWDPNARLIDQDLDHVRAEVIYPGGFGLQFCTAPDAEYQRECMRVYNDWISEFCAAAPQRLFGAGLLPMRGPIEWAIAEAERAVKKGLHSVLIPAGLPGRPYSHPDYAPLWEALQDIGILVATHSGTHDQHAVITRCHELGIGLGIMEAKVFQPMHAFCALIWAGVPQQYPKLRFVVVEGGIGWIASLLGYMDHFWKDHHHWLEPTLDEAPSTYFKRQFWATFEDDRAGILTRELLGVDHLMWGADYPHTEGTFPYSQQQVAKDFAGIPQEDVQKMTSDNAARLYGLMM